MARAGGGATPNAILAHAWPPDLDPARVPFRQRTITTLQRMRLWDDMTQIAGIRRRDERTYRSPDRFGRGELKIPDAQR